MKIKTEQSNSSEIPNSSKDERATEMFNSYVKHLTRNGTIQVNRLDLHRKTWEAAILGQDEANENLLLGSMKMVKRLEELQKENEEWKEANKVLREAVEDHVSIYDHAPWCRPQEELQCVCMDREYYREEASLERMKQALAKADEIMGGRE